MEQCSRRSGHRTYTVNGFKNAYDRATGHDGTPKAEDLPVHHHPSVQVSNNQLILAGASLKLETNGLMEQYIA